MTPQSVFSLVSYIGVVVQVGATSLLLALFYLLTRHAGTRPYFVRWAWAWFALVPALLLVVIRYLVASGGTPDTEPPSSAVLSLLHSGYLLGKLLHFGLFISGVWLFARGALPPVRPLVWVAGSVILAAVGGVGSSNLLRAMIVQGPIAVATFALGSLLLLRLPASRRTMGTRFTAATLGLHAGLWAGYWLAAMNSLPGPGASLGWLGRLLAMNSYVDSVTSALLVFGMVVILLEDTRREAEEARAEQLRAVEESEARLKAVIETATDGIVASDGDGRLVFVNGGAARLLGQRRSEMIGHPIANYFPEASRAQLERHLLEMRRTTPGRQAVFEVSGRGVNGREIPLEVSASTLARPGPSSTSSSCAT